MFYPIVITVVLFFFALGLRAVFKNLCAICFSIAGTWLIIIAAKFLLGIPVDTVVLGIYMGSSAAGLMYYLSPNLPERFSIFKLPFLISLIFIIYSFLYSKFEYSSILLIIVLWLVFLIILNFRNLSKFKDFNRKIIECCRNW